jgi:hypothetical protein
MDQMKVSFSNILERQVSQITFRLRNWNEVDPKVADTARIDLVVIPIKA